MPKDCTAVVIENNTHSPNWLYDKLETLDMVQYDLLGPEAHERKLPIVGAEPIRPLLFGVDEYPQTEQEFNQAFKELAKDPLAWAGMGLALITGCLPTEIKFNSFQHRALEATQRKGNKVGHRLRNDLCDLIVPHRMHAFADLQRSQGIEVPSLAVVMGAMHAQIARHLLLPKEELISRLKANEYLTPYYDPKYLDQIHYIEFDPTQDQYVEKVLTDPKMGN